MHRPPVASTAPVVRVVSLAAVVALSACGGDAGTRKQEAEAPPCATADTSAVAAAVMDYITKASPLPQRFLSAAGTDSALPSDGFRVLQDKGPTYFWSVEAKGQQQVRDKLEQAGPYTTLLVVWRGQQEQPGGSAVTVTLGGHYVGGEHEGKLAPDRAITVRCTDAQWRVAAP